MMLVNRLVWLFAAASLLTIGCGEKIEPGTTPSQPPRTVQAPVGEARLQPQAGAYEAVGSVKARTASTLAAKLMGRVESVAVNEGDSVRQGQVLVVLDAREVEARKRQAEAALAEARRGQQAALAARDAARAGAGLAEATYRRYTRLIQNESASRQEYDEVEARHRQAAADLSRLTAAAAAADQRVLQAQAGLASARVGAKDARVEAPFDAVVTARLVEPGDLATPGRALITLEAAGGFQAHLSVPEGYIRSLEPEQTLAVRVPDLTETVLTGTIATIVPAADPTTRSFTVKVDLPATAGMRSGAFVRALIPVAKEQLLLVPTAAVVTAGQLTGVYSLNAEGIARFRLIRTGRIFDDRVEVLSGLHDGDRFVSAPVPQLADGVRVEAAL